MPFEHVLVNVPVVGQLQVAFQDTELAAKVHVELFKLLVTKREPLEIVRFVRLPPVIVIGAGVVVVKSDRITP